MTIKCETWPGIDCGTRRRCISFKPFVSYRPHLYHSDYALSPIELCRQSGNFDVTAPHFACCQTLGMTNALNLTLRGSEFRGASGITMHDEITGISTSMIGHYTDILLRLKSCD